MERLEVKKLNHHFGFSEILRDINFTLNKGEVLSIEVQAEAAKRHFCIFAPIFLTLKRGAL